MDYIKLSSVLIFIILWQILAYILQSQSLPTPVFVLESFYHHLVEGELLYHLGVTLYKVLIAFIFAMLLGTVFGIVMGKYSLADRFLDPWLILGLNIPALVIIMLCYIWIGLTDVAAIVAVVINKVPTVIVNIREGVRAIDQKLVEVAKLYQLSSVKSLYYVYLPQLYPYIIASARNGLSLIWKIVLVVELLGRGSGIGFQFSIFFQFFDIASILAYSFSFIMIIMFIEQLLFKPFEYKMSRWK